MASHGHASYGLHMRSVAAVIVTRNRLQLLLECIAAVRGQERPPDQILVIDNASDDGTAEALARLALEVPGLRSIRLRVNTGGAGGFHRGMLEAYQAGHEWLWLMDDDSLPRKDALRQLLAGIDRFPTDSGPVLVCSRVEWTDGSLHPLNLVAPATADKQWQYACAEKGMLSLRAASFVSVLAHRACIERHGLPMAAYFLWMDDVEWTARVLRHERGAMVPASVVVHRTGTPARTQDAPPARFYLYVRNSYWMLIGSDCYTWPEKVHRLLVLKYVILLWLGRRWWRPQDWFLVLGASLRGLIPPRRGAPPPPSEALRSGA